MYGKLRAKELILGHRARKVGNNRVREKKWLIKRKAWDHIEHKAPEAWGTWNIEASRDGGI